MRWRAPQPGINPGAGCNAALPVARQANIRAGSPKPPIVENWWQRLSLRDFFVVSGLAGQVGYGLSRLPGPEPA